MRLSPSRHPSSAWLLHTTRMIDGRAADRDHHCRYWRRLAVAVLASA